MTAFIPTLGGSLITGGGGGGAGSIYYRHTQASSSAVWVINHNFGVTPNTQVFTSGGVEIFAEIQNTSLNQVTVTFDNPQDGFAICS